jgi:retinol dehydrogenase-12
MTTLLSPILVTTAATSPRFAVRVVWVVSLLEFKTPAEKIAFDGNGAPVILDKPMENYMQTKVGGSWLAADFATRFGSSGILSVVSRLLRDEILGEMLMSAVRASGFFEDGIAEEHVCYSQGNYGTCSQLGSCILVC